MYQGVFHLLWILLCRDPFNLKIMVFIWPRKTFILLFSLTAPTSIFSVYTEIGFRKMLIFLYFPATILMLQYFDCFVTANFISPYPLSGCTFLELRKLAPNFLTVFSCCLYICLLYLLI